MGLQQWYEFSIFNFLQHYQYFFQNKIIVLKPFLAFGFVSIIYTANNIKQIEYHVILFCRDVWKGLIIQCKEDVIYMLFLYFAKFLFEVHSSIGIVRGTL